MTLISINDNYPCAFYGSFIANDGGSYTMFLKGEYIDNVPNFEIHFKISTHKIEQFNNWGILATNKMIPLVSITVKNQLSNLFKNDVQWIETICYNDYDNTILGPYYLLNITHNRIDESYQITREEEYGSIYVSKETVSFLKKNKIRGFSYIND